MQRFLFILGREPELSAAELEAVFGVKSVSVLNPETAIVDSDGLSDHFIDRLGGTIKIGRVIERISGQTSFEDLKARLDSELITKTLPPAARDIGFSLYGGSKREREGLQRFAMEIKKELKKQGKSIRIVTSREPQLSAVTIERQGLLKHGTEFLLSFGPHGGAIATTIAIQDYRQYALRDRGRPEADPRRGMIPPKLAQMMLNIVWVKPNDILLDPFVGVGTILQEAILLGVHEVHGSDIDQPAVRAAQINIRWLLKEFPGQAVEVEITQQDARSTTVRPTVIVTEPDLGKPRHGKESIQSLEKEAQRLEGLYIKTFEHWHQTLPPGGRVVMIWPVFSLPDADIQLDLGERISSLGFEPQPLLSEEAARRLSVQDPHVLEYARDQARVRRQIRSWVLPPPRALRNFPSSGKRG